MHNCTRSDAYVRGFDDALAGAEEEDCPYKSGLSDDWRQGWGVARAVMNARIREPNVRRSAA